MSAGRSPAFALPIRVFYEDTDAGGVVYYANYLRFLERARTEWLRQLGTPREQLRAQCGWVFVVTAVDARYMKPARLDDLLSVECEIADCQRSSLLFAQTVLRDGTLLMTAQVRVACVDSDTFRPRRLPASLLAQLQPSTTTTREP